jgi:hypothetical protein
MESWPFGSAIGNSEKMTYECANQTGNSHREQTLVVSEVGLRSERLFGI